MRLFISRLALAVVLMATAIGASAQAAQDSVSVAVGTMLGGTIGRIVSDFEGAGVQLDRAAVASAAEKAIRGTYSGMSLDRAQTIVDGILATMQPMAGVDSFDTASQERFLAEAAARPAAVATPSGGVLEVLVEGEGPMPGRESTVRIEYVGRLSDDTIFDATDGPLEFRVDQLTPGLAEALTMMRPGGKYRVTIPASTAYGEEGIPGVIPGRAALQFNIELVSFNN